MNIVNFTPLPALLGGLLIGIAAALLLISTGRIFGISGIVGGLLNPKKGDLLWRFFMVAGLILGAIIMQLITGNPKTVETVPTTLLIFGGLSMGFGTLLGSGCTSGHGVCGMSRFSVRSIVATLTFMFMGFITVYFLNI